MNTTTRILDGKQISADIRAELKLETEALAIRIGRKPGLATILVGENPASQTYVANKIKACQDVGMESIHLPLPGTTPVPEIVALIKKLNADPNVDGILLQLPLPGNVDSTQAKTRTVCILIILASSLSTRAGRRWLQGNLRFPARRMG